MDFNSDLLLIWIFYAKFLLRFDTKTDWKILRLERVFVKIEIEILDGSFFLYLLISLWQMCMEFVKTSYTLYN